MRYLLSTVSRAVNSIGSRAGSGMSASDFRAGSKFSSSSFHFSSRAEHVAIKWVGSSLPCMQSLQVEEPTSRSPFLFQKRAASVSRPWHPKRSRTVKFVLLVMSRDDHAVELIEPWRPRRNNTLLQRSQHCHKGVLARKHQCTTAITTMWTESLWAFPKSYTANDSWIVHSSDSGHRETKGLITPPTR